MNLSLSSGNPFLDGITLVVWGTTGIYILTGILCAISYFIAWIRGDARELRLNDVRLERLIEKFPTPFVLSVIVACFQIAYRLP